MVAGPRFELGIQAYETCVMPFHYPAIVHPVMLLKFPFCRRRHPFYSFIPGICPALITPEGMRRVLYGTDYFGYCLRGRACHFTIHNTVTTPICQRRVSSEGCAYYLLVSSHSLPGNHLTGRLLRPRFDSRTKR